MSLQNIRHLERQVKEVNQNIEREMAGLNIPLLTIPSLVPVLAASILSEIGNISNSPSDDAVAQYAGFFWPENHQAIFNPFGPGW